MRSRVLASWCLPAALSGVLIGCGTRTEATKSSGPPAESVPVDAGPPLFAAVAPPVYKATTERGEPLVVPNCVVQYEDRQTVSAEVDGTIELFATTFKPGEYEKLTAEQRAEWVVYHPRDPNPKSPTPLKRVREGATVDARQVVAFMDDQLIRARLEGAEKIKKSAVEARGNATRGVEAAQKKYDLSVEVGKAGNISRKDLLDDIITLSRFLENLDQSTQQIAKSEADYKEQEVLLGRHQIKSGVNGVIRTISRRPGEYVKAGEKIMEIEGTDKVRIEGQLDVQHMRAVRYGMEVTVEPALPSAPLASHTGHRQPVTGITVTAHPEGPLVVSVGADGTALVWDPNLGKSANRPKIPHNLPHPVGVKSVAATPATTKAALVITGGDDGKIRIWDVTNHDRLPTSPKTEPEDAHSSPVQAISVNHDGRFFATAAGRDVFVWDLATAKKLYSLPLEHRDSVTSVNFTPQNTLVTASKDGTIKVWKLGTERAAVVRTLDHRAGAIDVLGVSRDGARVLFDQDKTRVDLVDPATGQTVGQVQNVGSVGSFSTLAVFGQDEVPAGVDAATKPYTIVTAGSDGDLKGSVQVWQAERTGGRGSEVGRLITPGRAAVTTAAFSPVRREPFLVVGTAAGTVHLWKPPTEAPKKRSGRIVNIDATDTKYLTVRVEMNNSELQLLDHSIANVIINPEK
ncbi:efflux RND transporter periplasmic adaptor subunit [Gemmata sp. G18]|uniref:Efflux RND transporter periplasmic adaptor subunit n=1 Tax=Gemmata palustris TaxID=2822762 RepID=A0ABS5C6D0_9BACT|nr:efflux RND transporter periplasmic adaptor subunit [Gemmata palustris]MBP3961010.1 efflux RND transporter periplasmic adaptor subunit [Gemmata palustris]